MNKLMLAAAVAFLVAASWTMLAPDTAEACSCLPPDLSRSYNNSDEVFRAKVLKKIPMRRGQLMYIVRVEEAYKGCRREGTIAKVMTTRSGASCGVTWMERGESYLFTAHRGNRGRLQMYSCDYNTSWDNLSREDIHYLDTRYNCCGRRCGCVNAPEVQCFADPCSVASECSVEGAECVSNFCGGCNAEWYDSTGALVCQEEDNSCQSDDDCGDGTWCRPTQDDENVNACVPFAEEGDWCGGFTPIWAQSRCAPGLSCTDVPPFLADAPGICRQPCEGDRSCAEEDYCSENNNVCRDDGACYADNDCDAPGNNYPHIECVGYGVCNGGQCGWECGNAECRDLSNVDFGFCEALLGWGVVGGECRPISGCPGLEEGYTLYPSQRLCERNCEDGPDTCESDDDCSGDTWCRPTDEPGINACVPYQNEGDWCGGFTTVSGQNRCHPDLVCTDVPPFLADAPGICRQPCESNRSCAEEDYCSGNNDVCRDDGACYADNDCEANGNDYPHIECVGYGVCNDGQCGWECGDSACRDVSGTFFGFCRLTLGWAVVDGACELISGCPDDAAGYTFFENEASCERACGEEQAECRPTGCSGQICADQDVASTCEWREEYACYPKFGHCERQGDGECGWSNTRDFLACLESFNPTECSSDLDANACEAANGEYGQYGLLGSEFCLCRTSDHGAECDSGGDCEGQCMGPNDGCFEATVGTCSEFVSTFGCYCTMLDGQGAFLCVD